MSQFATVVRSKAESALPVLLLPSMLGVNILALFALDGVNRIPNWIKAAASLLLSF